VSLISINALHQLHIFIFFLAVFHVSYSAITMALGRAKVPYLWKISRLIYFFSYWWCEWCLMMFCLADTSMEGVGERGGGKRFRVLQRYISFSIQKYTFTSYYNL
jgi:hypothetical protein